jgi:WD40 repeat protein
LIASAASTSAVVIWDVEAERKTDRRKALQSHHRAANSVCWHNLPFCLVSASQDGSIHYWDVRTPDAPSITFAPRSDAVREVDFNPFYHNYFAAAFDDGTVQAWDLRKPNACERRITAHDGLVLSVAWHPQDSSILASGGRDGTVKVSFSSFNVWLFFNVL